ncbi:MAG: SufD family Fe-S cluster assembly protein, partial [Nitrososphaerota archaeon]|nr:SufD family Fe-S cluster assembly protein [Nitrososphaerota archaeon]
EIDLRPQLEIYTDEVRCSHGATAGKLDENMLFYLLSRGIAPEVAQPSEPELSLDPSLLPVDALHALHLRHDGLRERALPALHARAELDHGHVAYDVYPAVEPREAAQPRGSRARHSSSSSASGRPALAA